MNHISQGGLGPIQAGQTQLPDYPMGATREMKLVANTIAAATIKGGFTTCFTKSEIGKRECANREIEAFLKYKNEGTRRQHNCLRGHIENLQQYSNVEHETLKAFAELCGYTVVVSNNNKIIDIKPTVIQPTEKMKEVAKKVAEARVNNSQALSEEKEKNPSNMASYIQEITQSTLAGFTDYQRSRIPYLSSPSLPRDYMFKVIKSLIECNLDKKTINQYAKFYGYRVTWENEQPVKVKGIKV